MRYLILVYFLMITAYPVSAELVRALEYDRESDVWSMTVPGWTALLNISDPEMMEAYLELRPDEGEPMTATVDMAGETLPALMNIEEVNLCLKGTGIVVTLAYRASPVDNGIFSYSRLVFSQEDGFLGAVWDETSTVARGAVPASSVKTELQAVCQD